MDTSPSAPPWAGANRAFSTGLPVPSAGQNGEPHSPAVVGSWKAGDPFLSPQVALEMLFTGEPISAHKALQHGLLSRVVPEEQLEAETLRIAGRIATLSRPVVALGKATFYRQLPQSLNTAYQLASQAMVDNLGMQDGQEGIAAFVQKRKPRWSQ